MASQYGSAPFIAQNESQGRYVGGDALSVIEATVGACAEDAGYAGAVPAQGSCGSHEVRLHFCVGFWEKTGEALFELVAEGGDAACAVEEDLCDVCRWGQLRHKLFGQDRKHGIFAISYRIDAGGVIFKDAMLAGMEYPVCFGRTAVCYECAVLHDVFCVLVLGFGIGLGLFCGSFSCGSLLGG